MGDFSIWGRIVESAPKEYTVTVTAIPLRSEMRTQSADLLSSKCKSRGAALEVRRRLISELFARLQARGDSILSIDAD